MAGYAWVCHSCKAVNNPGESTCQYCGFASVATGAEIEEAVTGIKQPPALSKKELQHQRHAEFSALPLWKKPFAYSLRMVQFIGSVVFGLGIFSLSLQQILFGLALAFFAEVFFQILKGKSGAQQHIPQ
ncbi:hypothetical protein [Azonexus sp. R2A61]|uniref:hypothetical protein n=1 Tax=Azonexus sp. R2A61 TaxID=2744443 RepID=UPI001F26103C|nr:hypothetical protein [Azonexus sp. R2A61]